VVDRAIKSLAQLQPLSETIGLAYGQTPEQGWAGPGRGRGTPGRRRPTVGGRSSCAGWCGGQRARVTVMGWSGPLLRASESAACSVGSMDRPHLVLSAIQSVAYWQR
ncbi:hypothetical protein ABT030_49625, partial [Streptomyces mirabilis]|uniref:hypothetical protein n=1 Tax=Streptomyces mirabilis TaxID=68239 RepID=UPI0033206D65